MSEEFTDHALDRFRSYLLLLAQVRLGPEVRRKLEASDIVQQTLLEAHRDHANFRGQTVAAKVAWLRQILARNLANSIRDLRRGKRDLARERSLENALEESALRLEEWLAAEQSSPSMHAERQERAVRVAEAMTELPESQREAIILRYWHARSLAEIATELGVSTSAVTGLLQRGLRTLRNSLYDLH